MLPAGRCVIRTKIMSDRWPHMRSAGRALALAFACLTPFAAEASPLVATVDNPAVIGAAAAAGKHHEPGQSPRVIMSVTGFQPPQDGAVQVVVKAEKDDAGTEQEIGRFGIFPNAEFKATDLSKAQRFGLPLPNELASGGTVKLKVYLVPLRGDGKGARLDLGGAEIRQRPTKT